MIKKSGIGKFGFLLLILVWVLSLLLAACSDEKGGSPTSLPKDLPRDRILFLSNRDGWPDLYTVDQTGKTIQRLTESAAAEYGAVWSADGRKVAFTELEGDQASGDYARVRRVVTVDADGKNRKLITSDGFNPAWSPDGSRILFLRAIPQTTASSERNNANIAVLPQQATNQPGFTRTRTPLINPSQNSQPTVDTNPAVPEIQPTPRLGGTQTNNSGLKIGLYTAPADGSAGGRGGTPVTLVADNAVEGAWSPDGKKIAYIAGNNDLSQKRTLSLMNPDGGDKLSLTERAKLSDLDILHIAWSPDGLALAFTAVDTTHDRVGLYRLPIEGNNVRRLTDYNGSARDLTGLIWAYADYANPATRLHIGPVWSPNSRRIAFADGSSTITVVEADSGNRLSFPIGAAALGQDKDSVLNVTWLPDNRRLIYDRAAAGRNALLAQANFYIFDFFDETLETLDTVNKNTTSIAGPGVSFFTPLCCGVDLLGAGNATPTAKPTVQVNGITPEGKLIYVSGVGQRQLILADPKTQERTILSSGLFKLLDFSLSPRTDRMVYLEVGEKYSATLYLTMLSAGSTRRKLSEGTGDPDDLSNVVRWSPDGKQVAFQVLQGDPNLKPGLYALNVDGPDLNAAVPRLITDKEVSGFSWSPDGSQIAFKVDSVYYELWTVSVEAGPSSAQRVAQLNPVNPNYASLGKGVAWSPNGQWVALAGPSNYSRFSLWLVSPTSGQVRETPTSVIARVSGWTPDSTRVMTVVASFSQNTDIQIFNLNTNSWRQYGIGSGPQISGDGLFVTYYARYDLRLNGSSINPNDAPNRMAILQLANGDIRTIPFDFSPYFGFKARFFSWSPDAKLVAYYYNNSIYGVGVNGQNPQVLGRAFTVDKLAWAK